MDRKKILIVTQQYPPEANAFRISDMVKYLSDNLDVTILSPHPTIPIGTFKRKWKVSESVVINSIKVVNLWTWQPKSSDPGFLSRMSYYLLFSLHATIWSLINSKKFDLILTSTPPIFVNLPGLICKQLLKKPWIVDVRDLWIDAAIGLGFLKEGSINEKMSRKFEKVCYEKSDKICVTTNVIEEKISKRYPHIDKEKFLLISNGVDIRLFYPVSCEKKQQIIFVGNVGHAYCLEQIILSLKEINKSKNLKLLIVGAGDKKAELMKFVDDNCLNDLVEFTGYLPRAEVPKLISESLLGVAPLKDLESLEYIVPIKAYEYMACGVPFLGCGRNEIEQIANKSGAGIIVKNDPKIISRVIVDLIKNKDLLKQMGENGRKYVEKYYDRKVIAEELNKSIDLLLRP